MPTHVGIIHRRVLMNNSCFCSRSFAVNFGTLELNYEVDWD